MKIRNNEIFIIIEHFSHNFIFEIFSHDSHFNNFENIDEKKMIINLTINVADLIDIINIRIIITIK